VNFISSGGTKGFVMWIKNVGVCFVNYFPSGVPENRGNTIQISHLRWMPLKGERVENGFVAPFYNQLSANLRKE